LSFRQRLDADRTLRDLPAQRLAGELLLGASGAGIGMNDFFLAVRQLIDDFDIRLVGRRVTTVWTQTGVDFGADVRLHAACLLQAGRTPCFPLLVRYISGARLRAAFVAELGAAMIVHRREPPRV
jgi:hypothetical protein